MLIQYVYALLTILPCPIWFWYRWASASFLITVFTWSIWNGATYYMDVFGKRFQKELEAMKAEVAKWQSSPESMLTSPLMTPHPGSVGDDNESKRLGEAVAAHTLEDPIGNGSSVDSIPLLSEEKVARVATSGIEVGESAKDVARERKAREAEDF